MSLLCFPFLSAPGIPDPETAIKSIVSLAWLIAYVSDVDLVKKARLGRVLHKMDIKEEEGDLWFNKGCSSDRIATVIRAGGKKTWFTCTSVEDQSTTHSRISWVGSWRVVKAGAGLACSTPPCGSWRYVVTTT